MASTNKDNNDVDQYYYSTYSPGNNSNIFQQLHYHYPQAPLLPLPPSPYSGRMKQQQQQQQYTSNYRRISHNKHKYYNRNKSDAAKFSMTHLALLTLLIRSISFLPLSSIFLNNPATAFLSTIVNGGGTTSVISSSSTDDGMVSSSSSYPYSNNNYISFSDDHVTVTVFQSPDSSNNNDALSSVVGVEEGTKGEGDRTPLYLSDILAAATNIPPRATQQDQQQCIHPEDTTGSCIASPTSENRSLQQQIDLYFESLSSRQKQPSDVEAATFTTGEIPSTTQHQLTNYDKDPVDTLITTINTVTTGTTAVYTVEGENGEFFYTTASVEDEDSQDYVPQETQQQQQNDLEEILQKIEGFPWEKSKVLFQIMEQYHAGSMDDKDVEEIAQSLGFNLHGVTTGSL